KSNSLPPAIIFGLTGHVSEADFAHYRDCKMNGCIAKGELIAHSVAKALAAMEANPSEFIILADAGGMKTPKSRPRGDSPLSPTGLSSPSPSSPSPLGSFAQDIAHTTPSSISTPSSPPLAVTLPAPTSLSALSP